MEFAAENDNGSGSSMDHKQGAPGLVSESAAQKSKERMERWKALKYRAVYAAASRCVIPC